ncbi:uncharacterized protein [Lepidochelys kempii]|uniref:uncharacterized protein isoform X5 n=1 Tax=Lepidochelys kempii TaxID=8472 RepID=UPI003C6FC59B
MWGAELAGEAGAGRARPGQEPPLPAPPPPRAREPFEPPRERRAPLGKEREAAEAEEQRQSQELLSRTAAERQEMVWEWRDLRGFLAEQEQRLLSRLEELERAVVQRRDAGACRVSREISLLGERGGEKGQLLSPPLQGQAVVAMTTRSVPVGASAPDPKALYKGGSGQLSLWEKGGN